MTQRVSNHDRCSAAGTSLPSEDGRACLLCPGKSDVNLFRYGEGVIDLDAQISDSAFDLGVTQEQLDSA